MKDSFKKQETFEQVVEPVMKWLNENSNPHTQVQITTDGAELLEGSMSHITGKFIKD